MVGGGGGGVKEVIVVDLFRSGAPVNKAGEGVKK